MSDLIRREVVRRLIDSPRSKEQMLHVLGSIPSVDAEPVRHGHWEKLYDRNYKCSVCGAWYEADEEEILDFDYCPHCGAKMDSLGE